MRKAGIVLSLALAGCATAPGYRASEVPVPSAFRETQDTIIETPATLAPRTSTFSTVTAERRITSP